MRNAAPGADETERAELFHPRRERVIVDGYNVIFAWDELRALADSGHIDAARERLMDALSNYAAFTRREVVVVFDGYRVPGGRESASALVYISVGAESLKTTPRPVRTMPHVPEGLAGSDARAADGARGADTPVQEKLQNAIRLYSGEKFESGDRLGRRRVPYRVSRRRIRGRLGSAAVVRRAIAEPVLTYRIGLPPISWMRRAF